MDSKEVLKEQERNHLRHAERRLRDVQKGLAKSNQQDLLEEVIKLKEQVIKRFESLGGIWKS